MLPQLPKGLPKRQKRLFLTAKSAYKPCWTGASSYLFNSKPRPVPQVLMAVVNTSRLPKGSLTVTSRVSHGVASMPGRAYL